MTLATEPPPVTTVPTDRADPGSAAPGARSRLVKPVLLAGGVGTRLWPLSRRSYPKQFVSLLGERTLFQDSARRVSGTDAAAGLAFDKPVVVANADFRFIVTEQLRDVGIEPGAVLIEPEGRNTAPAVLAAALHLLAEDEDAVVLVAPSDHAMPDAAAFRAAVACGLQAVAEGRLVTFGVRPTRPETGYGYLALSAPFEESPQPLLGFVEKPEAARAAAMLAAGTYAWNAGIFLFAARDLVAAFRAHAPEQVDAVADALAGKETDLDFVRLAPEPWRRLPDISLDHAVMEKAGNLSVVSLDTAWSDLGGWDAVWRESADGGADGVVTVGAAEAIDCRSTMLRADGGRMAVVGIGLSDVIVVATDDAVLVADMGRAQDVRLAVDVLKARGLAQATRFPRDHRPWGWFESLVVGDRFQVKRIVVRPGASLSLQSHLHRSEHWVVVEGTAKVTVDETSRLLTENESIYVPLGSVHRLENPGRLPVVLIEVQTGAYVGEDDIVRYEDVYARGQGAKG